METKLPVIVIVGPTASGKTSLAVQLAHEYGGEIICSDSRTIYKDMNVGTAKPSASERALVPHWGLDLVVPGERYTAADFQQYTYQKIEEIRARGHVPFIVGGSGLYVDAVLFEYEFGSQADTALRAKLTLLSIDELQEYCYKNSIILPQNSRNKRYLIRAIERKNITPKSRQQPSNEFIIVGIATDRKALRIRIAQRSEQLFEDGVVEEAIMLGKKYGWESEAMTGNIYPLVYEYLQKKLSLDQVKEKFITLDWRLAKRQLTWLRRNPYIHWHELDHAKRYLRDILVKLRSA